MRWGAMAEIRRVGVVGVGADAGGVGRGGAFHRAFRRADVGERRLRFADVRGKRGEEGGEFIGELRPPPMYASEGQGGGLGLRA